MIFYVRDKKTDMNLFEVEILSSKIAEKEYTYDISPNCYTSNILLVLENYNIRDLFVAVKDFESIRGVLFEMQKYTFEITHNKDKIIWFVKKYLTKYIVDFLNKEESKVYMVTD